jgi:hypothetical protein
MSTEPNVPRVLSKTFAFVCTAIALAAFVYQAKTQKLDAVALGLLVLAAVPWLLPYIETLKLPGGIEVDLKTLGKKVQDLHDGVSNLRGQVEESRAVVAATQSILVDGIGKDTSIRVAPTSSGAPGGSAGRILRAAPKGLRGQAGPLVREIMHPPDIASINAEKGSGLDEEATGATGKAAPAVVEDGDDPNKGHFGGKAEADGRSVSAVVVPLPNNSELFQIFLTVSSTDRARPLAEDDEVTFYLHPTFARPVMKVKVTQGKATLERIACGAFTVGVTIASSHTQLELDLAELPNAPEPFKSR